MACTAADALVAGIVPRPLPPPLTLTYPGIGTAELARIDSDLSVGGRRARCWLPPLTTSARSRTWRRLLAQVRGVFRRLAARCRATNGLSVWSLSLHLANACLGASFMSLNLT